MERETETKPHRITIPYLLAVGFIYVVTACAWLYLGAVTESRTNERDSTEIDVLRAQLEAQLEKNVRIQRHMQEIQITELAEGKIIARSANVVRAFGQARKVSQVDSTVLILGESGCGKGVIANLIHQYSSRADQPLIHVNCGAIPESLVESELFGYEKGAFTGAREKGKPGYF